MPGTPEEQARRQWHGDKVVRTKDDQDGELTQVADKGDTTKMRDLGGFGYCDRNACQPAPPPNFPQQENIELMNQAFKDALTEVLRRVPSQACSEVAATICVAATLSVFAATKDPVTTFGTLGACGLTAAAVCMPTAPPQKR